jgi:hypothetical protein
MEEARSAKDEDCLMVTGRPSPQFAAPSRRAARNTRGDKERIGRSGFPDCPRFIVLARFFGEITERKITSFRPLIASASKRAAHVQFLFLFYRTLNHSISPGIAVIPLPGETKLSWTQQRASMEVLSQQCIVEALTRITTMRGVSTRQFSSPDFTSAFYPGGDLL